jgi:membrane magnesium transporter 1
LSASKPAIASKLSTAQASGPYPSLIAPSGASPLSALPLDITIETIVSVGLLCLAIVLGAEELKPISWRVWAGKVEKDKESKKEIGKTQEDGYLWLEPGKRKGFVDIRQHRKEFASWAKGKSN